MIDQCRAETRPENNMISRTNFTCLNREPDETLSSSKSQRHLSPKSESSCVTAKGRGGGFHGLQDTRIDHVSSLGYRASYPRLQQQAHQQLGSIIARTERGLRKRLRLCFWVSFSSVLGIRAPCQLEILRVGLRVKKIMRKALFDLDCPSGNLQS